MGGPAHQSAKSCCLIGSFKRITAIIKIIVYLLVSVRKGVAGHVPAMTLKLIRKYIQAGVYRCFKKRFSHAFIIPVCVCQSFSVVGKG